MDSLLYYHQYMFHRVVHKTLYYFFTHFSVSSLHFFKIMKQSIDTKWQMLRVVNLLKQTKNLVNLRHKIVSVSTFPSEDQETQIHLDAQSLIY